MRIIAAAISVIMIIAVTAMLNACGYSYILLVVIPFSGFAVLLAGTVLRVIQWISTPLPFNITTTCGQQKSLEQIKNNPLENPGSHGMSLIRNLQELLFFRSLFRNTRWYRTGEKFPVYGSDKWLWLAAICFHWSLLASLMHHLRYLCKKTPALSDIVIAADNLFHIGTTGLYITNIVLIFALAALLVRRMLPRIRYLSLFQDYFLIMLVIATAGTGMLMRYFFRSDIDAVRTFMAGMMSLRPVVPDTPDVMLSIHIVLVSVLCACVPFSKIVHSMAAIVSPTRLLPGSARRYRHVNPWNPPVDLHGYGEWENEFREKLQKSGYTLESADGGKAE